MFLKSPQHHGLSNESLPPSSRQGRSAPESLDNNSSQLDPRSTDGGDAFQNQSLFGNSIVGQQFTQEEGASGATESPITALSRRANSPSELRAELARNPSLFSAIQAFFAAGNSDPKLNSLLAMAYPRVERDSPNRDTAEKGREKAGVGPGAVLPPARTGDKNLTKGRYKWSLTPVATDSAELKADFKPDHTKVEGTAVSFAQTVVNKVGNTRAYAGGTASDPAKNKSTYEPFEESSKHTRIDFHPGTENDPFYGAEWDQGSQKWVRETTAGSAVGSSDKGKSSTSATMSDPPDTPWAREGKGDVSIEFETVPLVLETRETLGSLKWGFKVKDKADAPLELTGARDADCVDTPSDEWGAALDKFYEARFETILDNFEIGKYALKPDHKTKLDGVVTRMTAKPGLKAQLGGAADFTGSAAFNEKLALQRANAAKDYLVSKGISAGRIEVQSYGFNWARVEAARGEHEGKNRRVQVWLR